MANYMARNRKQNESVAKRAANHIKLLRKNRIEAVECTHCNTLHKTDSEDYLVFVGNVNVGIKGGIVGDNLDENMRVTRTTIVCRNERCVVKTLVDKELPNKKQNKPIETYDRRECDCDEDECLVCNC